MHKFLLLICVYSPGIVADIPGGLLMSGSVLGSPLASHSALVAPAMGFPSCAQLGHACSLCPSACQEEGFVRAPGAPSCDPTKGKAPASPAAAMQACSFAWLQQGKCMGIQACFLVVKFTSRFY